MIPTHGVPIGGALRSTISSSLHSQKFAGCINAYLIKEDGFSEFDRILLIDAASILGGSIS
jgi:hypothetical protein